MTLPTSMRAVEADAFSIDALKLVERPVPVARRGEILVRVHCASLNYRDLAILAQGYLPTLPLPYVPASDAAGVVVAVGDDVTRFRVGDRVMPVYTQGWYDGKPTPEMRTKRTLGAPLSGVLQEYLAIPAEDAVPTPANLTDREAATLPIAALTAWSTLQEGGVKPGDTVLVQGTGGVAIFALQFAKLAGVKVIVTSSSDDKLARAQTLGADVAINYRKTPAWDVAVKEATGGRGVDIVVETAGASLDKSLACTAFGGFVGVIGFVAGREATIPIRSLIGPMIRVQGIAVGSRARFEAMNRAIGQHRLKPVIDAVYPLDEAAEAFRQMDRGAQFGKLVIDVAGAAS
jgi:NADPH:quinone reductase-like Zn-dependent oxidoreductase